MNWDEAYMEPEDFIRLTGAKYKDLADICGISDVSNVKKWFTKGTSHRPCQVKDKKLMWWAYHYYYKNLEVAQKSSCQT